MIYCLAGYLGNHTASRPPLRVGRRLFRTWLGQSWRLDRLGFTRDFQLLNEEGASSHCKRQGQHDELQQVVEAGSLHRADVSRGTSTTQASRSIQPYESKHKGRDIHACHGQV